MILSTYQWWYSLSTREIVIPSDRLWARVDLENIFQAVEKLNSWKVHIDINLPHESFFNIFTPVLWRPEKSCYSTFWYISRNYFAQDMYLRDKLCHGGLTSKRSHILLCIFLGVFYKFCFTPKLKLVKIYWNIALDDHFNVLEKGLSPKIKK